MFFCAEWLDDEGACSRRPTGLLTGAFGKVGQVPMVHFAVIGGPWAHRQTSFFRF